MTQSDSTGGTRKMENDYDDEERRHTTTTIQHNTWNIIVIGKI